VNDHDVIIALCLFDVLIVIFFVCVCIVLDRITRRLGP
jgi:hypothetical protein